MGGVAAIVKSNPKIFKKVNTPTPVSPTVAEVSQATATNMDGYDNRKSKRQGRSSTILTSSTGVQGETTLSKKSLLGA